MIIAIIADSHDHLANLKKMVGWAKNHEVKVLIHCGDICSPEVLREALQDFSGQIFLCLGNADEGRDWQKKAESSWQVFEKSGEMKISKTKIAFSHWPERARELAKTKKYGLVFYGHTHKPWEEKIGDCRLVNPGNLAGLLYLSTFAVYDTEKDKLELKILEQLETGNK